MISKIVDAISLAVNAEFGDDCKIYTEIVEQDIKRPCFFIACLGFSSEQQRDKRYLLKHQMTVQYLTSSTEPNAELYGVVGRLNKCLECISIDGDLTRSSKSKAEIMDELLSLTIDYDFYVIEKSEEQKMESVSVATGAKGWL